MLSFLDWSRNVLGSAASVILFGKPVKRIPRSTQLGQYRNGFKMRVSVHWEEFYPLHQEGKHHEELPSISARSQGRRH